MAKQSKFEKYEMDVIDRGQIAGADYNPRVISKDAEKRLQKAIAKHGLVQPLVWNRRTGNLVAGHQRLRALDMLEKSKSYQISVAVVDIDEREERILNVQLNNPSMQGDWDLDKLTELAVDAAISPDEMGFSEGDTAVLFGGNEEVAALFSDTQGVSEAKNTLKGIKEHRAESAEKMKDSCNVDYYFTVVCENKEQKAAILKILGVPGWESYAPGRALAGALGV